MSEAPHRGRFAPSPSGNLHLGSLVAAIASYCEAKSKQGEWLVRIEDVDETRTVAGADQQILETLNRFGLHPDGPVIYQTSPERQQAYQSALDFLQAQNLTYPCTCTRKQLAGHQVYPGTCRQLAANPDQMHSIRLKTRNEVYGFNDQFQGQQQQCIAEQSGDFNIKRKDGLFCYQLAVVIDDADQGITDVVRGIDIMDSTSRQMHLIKLLGLSQPNYAHFPVVINQYQRKLSKQNHAKPIAHEDPYTVTALALKLLQQDVPVLAVKSQVELLKHAVTHWQPEKMHRLTSVVY